MPRTEKRRALPCALTIAGSDSGGGAGIQADLKTFAALGVHGTSAVTCVTAQSPNGVRSIQAIRPAIVRDQIEAVCSDLKPAALKTGMLYSAGIIQTVAQAIRNTGLRLVVDPVMIATSGAVLLKRSAIRSLLEELLPEALIVTPNIDEADAIRNTGLRLVVDPVMIATSGAVLLKRSAIRSLLEELLPEALIVTPNIDEAELILARKIAEPEEAREAARELHARFGCAALVKGGHLAGLTVAADFFFDGETEWMLEAPFFRGFSNHGTGCTYSAAIAAHLALGFSLPEAVLRAKEFISNAIARSTRTAGYDVLNPFWRSS